MFNIGEEVILWPKYNSELRGEEATILTIVHGKEHYVCTHCGETKQRLENANCPGTVNWGVQLDMVISGGPCCRLLNGASLRKKPKPSDDSYEEIIKSLNSFEPTLD